MEDKDQITLMNAIEAFEVKVLPLSVDDVIVSMMSPYFFLPFDTNFITKTGERKYLHKDFMFEKKKKKVILLGVIGKFTAFWCTADVPSSLYG